METIFADMTKGIDKKLMQKAGDILKEGGLVAFPTETVYGLGGNALDAEASRKIYAAKGRPSDNPLIVHIADFDALPKIVKEVPKAARDLADAFWPGPMTMILNKNDRVPMSTTGGLSTVAVRFPDNEIADAMILAGGGYIAAPSANTSGRPSPTTAQHVQDDLDGKIDMIIDGGPVGIGVESTIIDLTEDIPMILRPGYINMDMLRDVLGEVRMDPGLHSADPNFHPKAPGMKYRHYAPKAPLTIVEGPADLVVDKINELSQEGEAAGKRVGIIATDETAARYHHGIIKSIGTRTEEITISMHLYGILRDFDALNADMIYSEAFETPNLGQAIMNRLIKAAGHQVIKV